MYNPTDFKPEFRVKRNDFPGDKVMIAIYTCHDGIEEGLVVKYPTKDMAVRGLDKLKQMVIKA